MSPTIVIPLSVPPFRCVNICFEYLDHPHGGSNSKKFACNAGDPDSIPGPGRFPGEGNSNPFQYPCLEKISWTEEPGGLQSLGLQRVGHDWVINTFVYLGAPMLDA